MTNDRHARWLALASNVGALIGLLLIVLQLQQNRALMRAQVRHDLAMGIVELLNTPANNSQLASVLRRGQAGDALTPDEQYQCSPRTLFAAFHVGARRIAHESHVPNDMSDC